MSDDWKTPSQRHLTGHMAEGGGWSVGFFADRGDVIIRHRGQDMRLGADAREHFQRLYMQAEREAEAWTAQNPPGGGDVVTAEIWCGDPGKCPNGPADHLWAAACPDWPVNFAAAT